MAFDLSDLLKDVSNLDTNREQIEYIRLDQIWNDPKNFYLLSGVEDLAANIALCGLQQPIRVRKHPSEAGQYMIVSGHRRRAAVELLAKDDPDRWQEVACIIEQDEVSPALQQLRLIYANSNTRAMTSAELGEQAAQVEKLLYQLKEDGYDFPGRMRDHVAEAVNASKTKLARLKVIREKLAGCWKTSYRADVIKEATAYALAQLPKEWQEAIYKVHKEKPQYCYQNTVENAASRIQRITDIQCTHGCTQGCQNLPAMIERNVKEIYGYCTGCCFDCWNLRTCRSSCTMAAAKKKELKNTEKAANQAAADREAERQRPIIEFTKGVYERIGKARNAAGVTVEELYKAQGVRYLITDEEKQRKLEAGLADFGPYTSLPFGCSVYPDNAKKMCAVADVLHCSIDYLLGREKNVSNSDTWKQGYPAEPGTYVVFTQYCDGGKRTPDEMDWMDGKWWHFGQDVEALGFKILAWTERPQIDDPAPTPLNDACMTGLSPTGHCGAAAYCSEEYTCCAACPDPCNGKCGWLDQEDNNDQIAAATAMILEAGVASVSMLQRKLKLGYSAASSLMDELERKGVVGPYNGSNPREILIKKEDKQT